MKTVGYHTGTQSAKAAMTSDIVMRAGVTAQDVANSIESTRPNMDHYTGMNRKYTPFAFDGLSGSPICGGRYLFDTRKNADDYFKWTHEELEIEPGVKFWDWPVFERVEKFIWDVVGAEDFTPVETHNVNRFERWRYDHDLALSDLQNSWTSVRDSASKAGRGGVWLLHHEAQKLVGVLTVDAVQLPFEQTVEDIDLSALVETPSRGQLFPATLGLTKIFDRTSYVMSTWLPLSRSGGGQHVAHPTSVLPRPAL